MVDGTVADDQAAAGGPQPPHVRVREAAFADLDTRTLYAILRLRLDVFVVEQQCAYRELDGRDTEPATRHLWMAADDGAIITYLRMINETGGTTRIGRVVTARAHRGQGLAGVLVRHAVVRAGGPVVADAQIHLQRWYEQQGFVVTGPVFDDAGIAHVPMRRDPAHREPAGPRALHQHDEHGRASRRGPPPGTADA